MDCKSPGPRWELIEQGSACAGGADLQGISAPKAEPGRGPRRMPGRREQEAAKAIRSAEEVERHQHEAEARLKAFEAMKGSDLWRLARS